MDPIVDNSDIVRSVESVTQHRAAQFAPATVDDSARTVELVFTTGARARRMTRDGSPYEEKLEVSEAAVRMDRLLAGAPLLLDHMASTHRQVGVVESARIENGQGIAVVRFSKRAEVEPIFQDVKDGIIRSVSVGYKVHRYVREDREDSDVPLLRAVDWEPAEISLVSIPADAAAQIRSDEKNDPAAPAIQTASEGAQKEERSMDPELNPAAPVATVDTAEIARRAAEDERARASEIRTAVRSVGLSDDVADRLIDAGTAVDAARSEILSAVAARQAATDTRTGSTATIIRDESETLVTRAADALFSRATGAEPTEAGRELRGLSLVEMARKFSGSSSSMSASQSVDAALSRRSGMHGTSDFANVLSNVVGRTLRNAYQTAQRTYTPFVREVEVSDFRPVSRVQFGDHPALQKVAEGAEFQYGTIGDGAETYALATYGKVVAITRQAIINDDLSAFSRIPAMQGAAAARLESDLVYAILSANPKMSDGKDLFHSGHGNSLTAALDVAGLAKIRAAGRKQRTMDGKELNVEFSFLIVNPDDELEAQKLLGSITPNASSEFNPFVNSMRLIVDPRVSAGQFHTAANPSFIDTIEVAYLSGQRGLQTFTREGFEVDGVEVKARLDVAAAAIDFRGMARGVKPS